MGCIRREKSVEFGGLDCCFWLCRLNKIKSNQIHKLKAVGSNELQWAGLKKEKEKKRKDRITKECRP